MSLAKRCDLCKKFYSSYGYNINNGQRSPNAIKLVSRNDTNDGLQDLATIDFCPECMRAITGLIETLKEKENA